MTAAAKGGAARVGRRVLNDGAKALGRMGRTDEELAARIGRKREQITQWRTGAITPGDANRALLQAKLKIPEPAWDQYATPRAPPRAGRGADDELAGVIASTPIDYAVPRDIDDGSVSSKAKRLDRLVRAMLDVIERDIERWIQVPGGGLSSDDEATLDAQFERAKQAHTLLDKLGKLTGESSQMPESRILRLPNWRKIQDAVIEALRPYPKALAAFVAALEDLGGET